MTAGMATLSKEEITRYDRQMLIDGWGETGQQRLKSSTVFVAGAGGLGSPVSIYLAVAGVGKIVICDADVVELSNLNRQILHPEGKLGEQKAVSAGGSLRALNSTIEVVTHTRVTRLLPSQTSSITSSSGPTRSNMGASLVWTEYGGAYSKISV